MPNDTVGTLIGIIIIIALGLGLWAKISHQTIPELLKGIISAIKGE
jgi:ABC-type phosphate/phosphonate transport system permease subunit